MHLHFSQDTNPMGTLVSANLIDNLSGCAFALTSGRGPKADNLTVLALQSVQGLLYHAVFHLMERGDQGSLAEQVAGIRPAGPLFIIAQKGVQVNWCETARQCTVLTKVFHKRC